MPTAAALCDEAAALLAARGVPDPRRDAEVLLAHVLDVERPRLHLDPGRKVGEADAGRFRGLVARRAGREPLQYLTGHQEFWSLPFRVTPAVLIPRPETEQLIEALLRVPLRPQPLLLDLGTGSGCLAVAAAHELPGARVVATDASADALAVARDNARLNEVAARITFLRGDLFEPLAGSGAEGGFDAILSNPPYISRREMETLAPEVRDHEPRLALSPGSDALSAHRRIAAGAAPWLRPGGHVIVEIGCGQARALRRIYGTAPGLERCEVFPDLAGVPRVLRARRRPGE
jgi:release factor glutamine methyltransferase